MSRVHRPGLRPSLRRLIQISSAVLFNGYLLGFGTGRIFTGASKAVCVPVLNCYSCPGALGACPIGSLQAALGRRGGRFPFYVLGSLMLFGVVLGRLICGFLCPFGLVQELLHRIPAHRLHVAPGLDRALRYLKYVVLAVLVVILPLAVLDANGVSKPYFCEFLCPAGTLEGGLPLLMLDSRLRQAAGWLFDWKLMVLAAVLGLSVFIERPFCKYLCPLGAFYALFNRFSLYRMHLDTQRCIGCRRCEAVCPMQVKVTDDINGPECIRCGQCVKACPVKAITAGFELAGPTAGSARRGDG